MTSLCLSVLTYEIRKVCTSSYFVGLPCGSDGKESAFSAGDLGSIPRLGRSLGEGNGNPV